MTEQNRHICSTNTHKDPAMKIQSLGHVVLRVANRQRSEKFYGDVLGLPICARFDEQGMKMAFFSLGNHHDLAISEVGEGTERATDGPGLDHCVFWRR